MLGCRRVQLLLVILWSGREARPHFCYAFQLHKQGTWLEFRDVCVMALSCHSSDVIRRLNNFGDSCVAAMYVMRQILAFKVLCLRIMRQPQSAWNQTFGKQRLTGCSAGARTPATLFHIGTDTDFCDPSRSWVPSCGSASGLSWSKSRERTTYW